MRTVFYYILLFVLLFCSAAVKGQTLAVKNAAKRYEINAKRAGVDPAKEEGLPASREFIRIDSTYYVGWMFQGIYQKEHAADFLGYKNAAEPLEKALNLIERDYKRELQTRSSRINVYFPAYTLQLDYSNIAYELFQCYQNSEQNMQSYALLRRVQQWNMQREYYLNAYTMLSWITHRNRFYTSDKYSFLRNTISENEQLSNAYLDSALARIDNNISVNEALFPPGYLTMERMGVYHYKSILYSYALNIDSAQYYYDMLHETAMFPYNNYATFCAIQAKFDEAAQNYDMASMQDGGDKRLQEWAYYSSLLEIYRGEPMKAAFNMNAMIRNAGSTPGFGWYNIALARALCYEGNIKESEHYIDKAADFKEVHIGTTLGQTHYEFSVNMVRLMNNIKRIQQQKFEDKNWWWHPGSLYQIAMLSGKKYLQQYLIVNQFAMNPERDMVVYKLFSSESTISWDEIWFLIRDFSTNFFVKKFREELQKDQREKVYKYFNLYIARLEMEKGHYQKAQQLLLKTLSYTADIDEAYEKLYLARVLESLAICADKNGNKELHDQYLNNMYSLYPQLLPYSTLTPQMKLRVNGDPGNIINSLKKYHVDWKSQSIYAPVAHLDFYKENNKTTLMYSVTDYQGKTIVKPSKLVILDDKKAVKSLAYGLFNIQSFDPQTDIETGS